MKRLYAYRGFLLAIPFLFIWVFMAMMRPEIAMSDGISGTVDVTYLKSKSVIDGVVTETKTSGLSQGYTLGLSRRLTSTISLSGNVRITMTERDGKKDTRYSPHIFLNYTSPFPEYFNLSMGYSRSENYLKSSSMLATDTFNTILSIPSVRRWLPSLSLSYNQSDNKDDLSPHNIDSTTKSISISSNYNLSVRDTPIGFSYSYHSSETDNNIEESTSKNLNHRGSTSFNRSFWDNRINVGGNFGLSRSENIQESLTGPRLFEEERTSSEGLYSDNPPNPVNVSLTSTPDLINNNRSSNVADPVSGALIDLSNADQNIGLGFASPQKIHKILLYTSLDPTPSLLTWILYTSDDNITWDPQGSPTVVSGTTFNGFIFTFTGVEARYFKVVNTAPYPSTLNITEIEAKGYFSETPSEVIETVTKREFSGLNISFRPADKVTLSYSINYSNSDSESTDFTSISQSAGISYIIFPRYLTLSTNYSFQSSKPSSGDKSGSKTYSLSFTTTPLETLRANLGTGYSESISKGSVISTSNNVTTGVSMELYKGIDLRLNAGLSSSDNKADKSTTDSSSISGNLRLIPWKPVQIILRNSHSSTKNSGEKTKSSSSSLRSDIFYNFSNNLYLTAYFYIEPKSSQRYSISWRPTQKIQTSLNYEVSQSDTRSLSSNINWTPIKRLTMKTSYSLSREDNGDKQESFLLDISIRL